MDADEAAEVSDWDSCWVCDHSRVDHAGDECAADPDGYFGHGDGPCNCDGFTEVTERLDALIRGTKRQDQAP